MKKVGSLLLPTLLVAVTASTYTMADEISGQQIFKQKLRRKCGFSGVKFAKSHTQMEWENIYENGLFPQETKKICPRVKLEMIQDDWWVDLYEFANAYASDGAVPSC